MDDYYIFVPLAAGIVALAVIALLMYAIGRRPAGNATMIDISSAIQAGMRIYLTRAFVSILLFVVIVSGLIWLTGFLWPRNGFNQLTAISFLIGAVLTASAAGVGIWTAGRTSSRATEAARMRGIKGGLRVAMNGGTIMGVGATGLALLGLCIVWRLFRDEEHPLLSMGAINAYALGASVVAVLMRFSGGIFAKAADISANAIGRLDSEISENDVRNAATIADHLGDHLGDVGGFGSELMASFIAAIVAALSMCAVLRLNAAITALPFLLASAGVICSIAGVYLVRIFAREDPRMALLFGASSGVVLFALSAVATIYVVLGFDHDSRSFDERGVVTATLAGIFCGAIVGAAGHYFTSNRWRSTRRVAEASQFGPALAVIEGLRAGLLSCMVPAVAVAAALWIAHDQAGQFGICLAAIGMLATAGMIMAMNAFGPIIDNAGGIAELAHLDRSVREITGILDAVGHASTAVSKGVANGAAAIVSFALLIAFIRLSRVDVDQLTILNTKFTIGLLIGAGAPYLVSALILGAVGRTAVTLIDEVRRQVRDTPGILEGKGLPDYAQCVDLATHGTIRGTMLPALIAVLLPVAVGFGFGRDMLAGLIAGAVIGGLMLGALSANSGGSLSNAKRYIEDGVLGGKGSPAHRDAEIGDMVGDPLKDAVAPAVGVLITTMAVVALVMAPLLKAIGN